MVHINYISVSASINDWLDHKRTSIEIDTLKASISEGERDVETFEEELQEAKVKVDNEKDDITNIQQFLEIVRPLRDDCAKVDRKKSDLITKKSQLEFSAPDLGGQDLETVERDLQRKSEEKDKLQSQITDFNQELSKLSSDLSQLTKKSNQAETLVRQKELKFAEEQKTLTRKKELNEAIIKLDRSEQDVSFIHYMVIYSHQIAHLTLLPSISSFLQLKNKIHPFRQKEAIKAAERNKIRNESKEEGTKRSEILNVFLNDFHKFQNVSLQIGQFIKSDKLHRLKSLENKMRSILEEAKEEDADLNDLTPKLEEMKVKVQDREAKQANVMRNLELLNMIADQRKLEDEQDLLQDRMDRMDQVSVTAKHNTAKKNIEKFKSEIDRRLGSKDSLEIQQRDLKVSYSRYLLSS